MSCGPRTSSVTLVCLLLFVPLLKTPPDRLAERAAGVYVTRNVKEAGGSKDWQRGTTVPVPVPTPGEGRRLAVRRGGSNQVFQNQSNALPLLREAAFNARQDGNKARRVDALLATAHALSPLDARQAAVLLDEAIGVWSEMPEGHSLWRELAETAVRAPFLPTFTIPFFLQDRQSHFVSTVLKDRSVKDSLAERIVEFVSTRDAAKALDVALAIRDATRRAGSVEVVLKRWAVGQPAEAVSVARRISMSSKAARWTLGSIAAGIESADNAVALELARQAARDLKPADGFRLAAEQTYRVIGKWDTKEAEEALTKLLQNPRENAGLLSAFAAGVSVSEPSLALKAIAAIGRNSSQARMTAAAALRNVKPLDDAIRQSATQVATTILDAIPPPAKRSAGE